LVFSHRVSATPPPPTDPAAPDDLDLLVKAGLRLVHLLERHVEAAVRIAEAHVASDPVDLFPPRPLPNFPVDIGLTFSRIARAMRLTKALQVRLADRSKSAGMASDVSRDARSSPVRFHLNLRDPDGDHIEPSDAAPRLDYDGWERLEDEDTDGDLLSRPAPEIIAVIRSELRRAGDDLRPPGASPADPENVGVVRVVRGQALEREGDLPPQEREATNHTNHTNAIRRPP
jgi:hypothetical protein